MAVDDRRAGTTPDAASDEEVALARALEQVPRGAMFVAGIAVVLLLIGWFFVYLFIFLPRGSVG